MKRFFVFCLLALSFLCLSSCTKTPERIFDYQDSIKEVTGSFREAEAQTDVTLYFTEDEKGKLFPRRIEYSSPKEISGLSFTLEGENITAELEGIRIADTWFEKEKVFRYAVLFTLREEDIYSIETKSNGATIAKGKNEGEIWEVLIGKDGLPQSITYESTDGIIKFTKEKIVLDKSAS